MKHKTQHRFSILRNILLLFTVVYILINHRNIDENSKDIHKSFIEHANLNPMQGLQNLDVLKYNNYFHLS